MKKSIVFFALFILIQGMTLAQQKSSVDPKLLQSSILKYTEKNYKDYKITEAYKYDLVYEISVMKENVAEALVFDRTGKFLYKKTRAELGKTALQTRTTMPVSDLPADIQKYMEKEMTGSNIKGAYVYEEVYTTTAVKDSGIVNLVFDKNGSFLMVKKGFPAVQPPGDPKAAAPASKPAPPIPPAPPAPVMPDTKKKNE